MSHPDDGRVAQPIAVDVKNWAESAKPPVIKKTTVRTYILDPANPNIADRIVSIADYEPKRVRMVVDVLDTTVGLTTEAPTLTAAVVSIAAGPAPQGRALIARTGGEGYCFYGPDAFWLYPLGAVGRVTVTKEYHG